MIGNIDFDNFGIDVENKSEEELLCLATIELEKIQEAEQKIKWAKNDISWAKEQLQKLQEAYKIYVKAPEPFEKPTREELIARNAEIKNVKAYPSHVIPLVMPSDKELAEIYKEQQDSMTQDSKDLIDFIIKSKGA